MKNAEKLVCHKKMIGSIENNKEFYKKIDSYLLNNNLIDSKDGLKKEFLERENLGSIEIFEGIVMPHIVSAKLAETKIIIIHLDPVIKKWNQHIEKVNLVILLLIKKNEAELIIENIKKFIKSLTSESKIQNLLKTNEGEIMHSKIINEVTPRELIFLSESADKQEEVLELVLNKASDLGLLNNKEELYLAIKKREKEISTSVGFNVAMPHGKSNEVVKHFVGFVRLKKPICWNDSDEEASQLIFLIAVPKDNENNIHLKFISQLSKKILDEDFRNLLLTSNNPNDIYKELNKI